jgi:hypothetical protein
MTTQRDCDLCDAKNSVTSKIENNEALINGIKTLVPMHFLHCSNCGSDFASMEQCDLNKKEMVIAYDKLNEDIKLCMSGVLKPDADGYYVIIIKKLNEYSKPDDVYSLQGIKEIFDESSSVMKRMNNGGIYGEYGHPHGTLPYETEDDFKRRVITINENNICVHFSKIWLHSVKTEDKLNTQYFIMAKLKPAGHYGSLLKYILENKKEKLCFGIRAFGEETEINGIKEIVIKEIVTWDYIGMHPEQCVTKIN